MFENLNNKYRYLRSLVELRGQQDSSSESESKPYRLYWARRLLF
jgi:hypothetical protein